MNESSAGMTDYAELVLAPTGLSPLVSYLWNGKVSRFADLYVDLAFGSLPPAFADFV